MNSLDDEATVLRGRCLSYGDGITFFPLAEVLRQAAGIVPEDSEEDARIKLKSCFGEQLADATSRIESGIGLSQDLYGKDELFWGVRAVLEELARRRPLVVVFDDIHWAEPTFLDLIEDILDASLGVPLLLVCAARHELLEDRPGFAAGRRTASQIDLAELSRTESGRVVRNLLGEASLPKPLEQRILGLTEGNPLFIEQMLSMLIDDGRLREQAGRWVFSGTADVLSVPGNVSSLLGARLDRLGATELRVVESASVIGLEFATSALSVLLEESVAEADLERALAGLCSKQLIRRAEPGRSRRLPLQPYPGPRHGIRPPAQAHPGPAARTFRRLVHRHGRVPARRVRRDHRLPPRAVVSLPGRARPDRRRRAAARRRGVTAPELGRPSRPGPRRHAGGGQHCCSGPPRCSARKTQPARCSSSTRARRRSTSANSSGPSRC